MRTKISGGLQAKLLSHGLTPFQAKVLLIVSTVPMGKTVTYKQLARMAGRPKAYRAVGTALNRNPFPVRIPCHRVVRSDGDIGGYFYGKRKKMELLVREGAIKR
ncbi:MAG: MGMT family protein [Candidatus Micrarchaeota archaeon]|nr:MGMT family protein [Candidatus Micrarchaeota archaeon]